MNLTEAQQKTMTRAIEALFGMPTPMELSEKEELAELMRAASRLDFLLTARAKRYPDDVNLKEALSLSHDIYTDLLGHNRDVENQKNAEPLCTSRW